jgi:hypothetical protein
MLGAHQASDVCHRKSALTPDVTLVTGDDDIATTCCAPSVRLRIMASLDDMDLRRVRRNTRHVGVKVAAGVRLPLSLCAPNRLGLCRTRAG